MKIATAAAPLLFAATMLTAGVLAATQANAADTRLSDVGFINSARCAGLAQGLDRDAAAYDRGMEADSAQREPLALVIAQSAHADAVRTAQQSNYWRARAQAELETRCPSYLPGSVARNGSPAGEPHTGR
jgi:hypothetical protein